MKKGLWKASVLFVLLAGFAAMSFGAQAAQTPVKYKLTLENGKIIEGEIVARTATTISIKDATLGVIAIARENILKIEPPLDEASPANMTTPPPAAPRMAAEPYAQPARGMGNITFGVSLSGGLGMIDGGDFNQYIRDYNVWVNDINDYAGFEIYNVDWKEMKSVTPFGGEIYARFGRNFGVGLGVEYLKKSNPGSFGYIFEDSWTTYHSGYRIEYDENSYETDTISQSLSVIPITLSLYGFLPFGQNFEGYIKAGAGYYLGKLTTDWTEEWNWYYNQNYFYTSGAEWDPHWHEAGAGTAVTNLEATCNTLGFHFGAGFNFNVSNNIALFGEAFYRMANFNDWQGTGAYDFNYEEGWGWTNTTTTGTPGGLPSHYTDSFSDDIDGKLWSFDDIWDFLDQGSYLSYWLYEAGDEPNENSITENVRPTEININGFNFKVGIRISFGGRR